MAYPFVYLNHGPLDPDFFAKAESIWIAFQSPVPQAERRAIMESCPTPFAGFFWWDDTLFYSESEGDVYDSTIIDEYGEGAAEITEKVATAFSKAVEAWIVGIHERAPVAFFIGPNMPVEGDPWDVWSYAQVGRVLVPWLEKYLDEHRELADAIEETDGNGESDDELHRGEPNGVNPFTGQPIYAAPPRALPMDRRVLANLAELVGHFADRVDAKALTGDERRRAEALARRLGGSS